jgi:hypothetical protein
MTKMNLTSFAKLAVATGGASLAAKAANFAASKASKSGKKIVAPLNHAASLQRHVNMTTPYINAR